MPVQKVDQPSDLIQPQQLPGRTSTTVDLSLSESGEPANQEGESEGEEDAGSTTETPAPRSATVATAPPISPPPSQDQSESSSEESATAVANSEPPAAANAESLAGNVSDNDEPELLSEPNRPLGSPPQGYPPVETDWIVNAVEKSTTQELPPLADIPTVARSDAQQAQLQENAVENTVPNTDQEEPASKAESSAQPIIADGEKTSDQQILSDPEISLQSAQPVPVSAERPDDPIAEPAQTTFVDGAAPQTDEANPASTAVFPNEELINEVANSAGFDIQDQQSEPPVVELPCFFDTPNLKWYLNPSPKFISFLSFKKILSNRPLNHPAPSDVFANDLALGLVPSSYFCSRNASEILMGL